MRNLKVGLLFAGAGVAVMSLAELPENVLYRNDFTTRESVGTVPRLGQTYVAQPYPTKSCKLYPYRDTAAVKQYGALGLQLNGLYSYLDFAPMYYEDVGDSRPSYDGWFEPYFAKGSADSHDNLFVHTGTIYMDKDADGNTNACFRFYYSPGSTATRTGTALKSLHNVFTNGQLKIQLDMKFPGAWLTSDAQFWVFPVYDKYMDIESWGGTSQITACSPGLFGVRSGTDKTKPYPQFYDVRKSTGGTTQLGNNYSGTKRVLWVRYVVTYDLDTARFGGQWDSLYECVEQADWSVSANYAKLPHPTFETPIPSSPVKSSSFKNALWLNCATNSSGQLTTDLAQLWKERGGISGIGFFLGKTGKGAGNGCGMGGGIDTATTNRVQVDNIRVSWKAPGASDFTVAYEDDFTTRKYTVLSAPDAGTAGSYAAGTETTGKTIDTFTEYVKGTDSKDESTDGYDKYALVPTRVKPATTTLQPTGVDGWRRLIPVESGDRGNGTPWTAKAHDVGTGSNMIEIGGSSLYGSVAQLIGEEVTSGKVKMSVDAFVPTHASDFDYIGDKSQRIAVSLGSTALYSSLTADIAGNTAAGGGAYLTKTDDVLSDVVYANGTGGALIEDPTVAIALSAWYRLELVADLDTKTYDLTVTPLGSLSVTPDFTPTNAPIVEVAGIPFASDVSGIGAFTLWGYGYGGREKYSKTYRTCFDNIRIWKITPGVDEAPDVAELLYSNDFDTRTRYLSSTTRASGRLAYQYDRDDGPDHWMRLSGSGDAYFGANATVRDDAGNQFLSVGRESGNGHRCGYTTTFGTNVVSGKVEFTADIRPPKNWWGRSGGTIAMALGNKTLAQGETKGYASGNLLRFGFRDKAGTSNGGVYSDIRPFADSTTSSGTKTYLTDASVKGADKWYRFRVKANLDAQTFDISLFDMGADHPTAGSPRGTLLGKATGLPFMNPVGEGLSTLYLGCYAISSTFGETGVDDLHALVDNIELKTLNAGTVILVK